MRRHDVLARGRPLAFLFLALVLVTVPLVGQSTSPLQVQQTLDTRQIYVSGTGTPDQAKLNLILTGSGPAGRYPIDCLLVIDTSATANLATADQVAFDLIDHLSRQDRVGILTFASNAQLAVPLAGNQSRLKSTIADLKTGGKTALGDALQTARQEFLQNGRPDAVWVEILLTDGQSDTGRPPSGEAAIAKEAGIKIAPVGIGILINRALLEELAGKTGGLFFPRPTATTVSQIMDLLSVKNAAQDIVIKTVLPAGLRFVGATSTPHSVRSNPDGTTSLTWDIPQLPIGTEWKTQVSLTATSAGTWTIDQSAGITYTNFRGADGTLSLPNLTITAITAITPPPPPTPPTADFSVEPASPTAREQVAFHDRSSDPDGTVVAWAWSFGDGTTSKDENPVHTYAHSGSYPVSLVVTDDDGLASKAFSKTLRVRDASPVARFDVLPAQPRLGTETTFDASKSYDPDGHIVSYSWDFNGDGEFDATSANPTATTLFSKAGETAVILKVTDNEGATTTAKKTINVLPSLSVSRTIDTCLPNDETIAGGGVEVTVTITANTQIHGLSLHENLPEGWSFTPVDNGSATLKKDSMDWLFLETLKAGDQRVIQYALTAPQTGSQTQETSVSIDGTVASASPKLSQMVLGEDKIMLVPTLPIPVVISRWDTKNDTINLCLPQEIAFDQIQYAVSLWLSGKPVPHTGDQTITLSVMRDLIAYWLTNTPAQDPLP